MKFEDIDWSKAPEGTTHVHKQLFNTFGPLWRKLDNGVVYMPSPRPRGWVAAGWFNKNYIPRPEEPKVVEWDGVGEPPVGIECWYTPTQHNRSRKVVVLATVENKAGTTLAVIEDEAGVVFSVALERLTRIDPKVEAVKEERQEFYLTVRGDLGSVLSKMYTDALFDAGYRKVLTK